VLRERFDTRHIHHVAEVQIFVNLDIEQICIVSDGRGITMKADSHDIDEDTLLRHLLQGTASETGRSFFRALVKNLSQALGTHGALVAEYLPEKERLRALAFWLGGKYVENYEYALAGTPCEAAIINKTYLHIPDKVVELFPKHLDLSKLGAVSYSGFPMMDSEDRVLGILAVVDTRTMSDSFRNLALFKIFATRAAAELLRMEAQARSREREEKINQLFRGAMDAIIELDESFYIRLLNPAAERLLGARSADLIGKSIAHFIPAEDRHKLQQIVSQLVYLPRSQQSIWVSEGVTIRTTQGNTIPAEATLSLYEIGPKRCYALIVRDINERYESRKLIESLRGETDYLRKEIQTIYSWGKIVGESNALRKSLQLAAEVAPTDTTVIVYGETGTGKELIARAIHAASQRKHRPLITVNCAAIPNALMESEFFGHEQGAFTGATRHREGRFALADGGTIFLDEVGELSREMQAKLLRVLQEGEFAPVGSSHSRHVDVRVIAATNCDLSRAVREGRFRNDLYFRLSVFPVTVPPLRERGDDIERLAIHLTREIASRMGREVDPPTPDLLERLKNYDWPGNVRELQNVIERGVITARYGRLNLDHALSLSHAEETQSDAPFSRDSRLGVKTMRDLQQLEKDNLVLAMQTARWRVAGKNGAAHLLGMPPSTLQSKLKSFGIKRWQ
jgi:PAS domain S-box-containing protein